GAVGDAIIAPEELAVLGVNADGTATRAEDGDVLANAAGFRDYDGGIARAAGVLDRGFPDELAGELVESDEGGLVAAGSADQLVAIHERRFAEAPAAHHAATEVLAVVLAPADVTLGNVEANQVAVR